MSSYFFFETAKGKWQGSLLLLLLPEQKRRVFRRSVISVLYQPESHPVKPGGGGKEENAHSCKQSLSRSLQIRFSLFSRLPCRTCSDPTNVTMSITMHEKMFALFGPTGAVSSFLDCCTFLACSKELNHPLIKVKFQPQPYSWPCLKGPQNSFSAKMLFSPLFQFI